MFKISETECLKLIYDNLDDYHIEKYLIENFNDEEDSLLMEYLDTLPRLSNYSDFCNCLRYLKDTYFNAKYRVYIKNDCLFIFRLEENSPIIENIEIYKFEDQLVKTIFSEYLDSATTDNGMLFVTNVENFNTLIANPTVLKLYIQLKINEASNIPTYLKWVKHCPNGKIRDLYEPHDTLKSLFKELNDIYYSIYGSDNLGIQCAYKKGYSIIDNAIPHKNNNYIFKGDISNFFPSCKRPLVYRYMKVAFEASSKWDEVLNYVLDKMLVDDALCLGNPISSVIANAIVAAPAKYIFNMCKRTGIAFTQYCDDLTFSSNRPLSKDFVINIFNEAYGHFGLTEYFQLKEQKLYGQTGLNRSVTGVGFDHTHNNDPTPKRRIYEYVRSSIYHYAHGDQIDMVKTKGQISYIIMFGKGKRILKYLRKFENINITDFISEKTISELDAMEE